MPPFGKSAGGMLTDQQIAALAQGMEQKWGNSAALAGQTSPPYADGAPGNPAHGQQAFTTYCSRCHGAGTATGATANGVVTGSLVDPSYLALITDQGLRSIILAGQTEQGPHDWRSYSTSPAPAAMTTRRSPTSSHGSPRIASQPPARSTSSTHTAETRMSELNHPDTPNPPSEITAPDARRPPCTRAAPSSSSSP